MKINFIYTALSPKRPPPMPTKYLVHFFYVYPRRHLLENGIPLTSLLRHELFHS